MWKHSIEGPARCAHSCPASEVHCHHGWADRQQTSEIRIHGGSEVGLSATTSDIPRLNTCIATCFFVGRLIVVNITKELKSYRSQIGNAQRLNPATMESLGRTNVTRRTFERHREPGQLTPGRTPTCSRLRRLTDQRASVESWYVGSEIPVHSGLVIRVVGFQPPSG